MLQKWGNNCWSKVLKTKKGIESVFKMEKLDWEDRVQDRAADRLGSGEMEFLPDCFCFLKAQGWVIHQRVKKDGGRYRFERGRFVE